MGMKITEDARWQLIVFAILFFGLIIGFILGNAYRKYSNKSALEKDKQVIELRELNEKVLKKMGEY